MNTQSPPQLNSLRTNLMEGGVLNIKNEHHVSIVQIKKKNSQLPDPLQNYLSLYY